LPPGPGKGIPFRSEPATGLPPAAEEDVVIPDSERLAVLLGLVDPSITPSHVFPFSPSPLGNAQALLRRALLDHGLPESTGSRRVSKAAEGACGPGGVSLTGDDLRTNVPASFAHDRSGRHRPYWSAYRTDPERTEDLRRGTSHEAILQVVTEQVDDECGQLAPTTMRRRDRNPGRRVGSRRDAGARLSVPEGRSCVTQHVKARI